jgi:ParB family transcriptional regulator, chromosome partitioning protein
MEQRTLRDLPIDLIQCPPQARTRFDEAAIASLAATIAAEGLYDPIQVRAVEKGFSLLDGERRLRACRLLGWTTIPGFVEERERSEGDVIVHALVANCQRESLTPIDLARAIERLMAAASLTAAEAAKRVALSAPTVTRTLALLTLPPDVQQHVHEGRIAASTGYAIARTRDPRARARLVARALRGELTRERAELASRRRTARRTRHARSHRVVLPLGSGRELMVSGDLTVGELCSGLGGLVARLRSLARSDLRVEVAARMLGAADGQTTDAATAEVPRA